MITKQLLKLNQRQIQNMTDVELRKVVSTLRSTARKRYERIVDKELYSPAVKELWGGVTGGDVLPSVKGMDVITLRNEFKRYKKFLGSKTSTVTGAKKFEKSQRNTLKDLTGVDFSKDDASKFWELFDQASTTGVGGVLNYRVVAEITAEVFDKNRDMTAHDILQEVEKRLNEIYESENEPFAIYPSKSM